MHMSSSDHCKVLFILDGETQRYLLTESSSLLLLQNCSSTLRDLFIVSVNVCP